MTSWFGIDIPGDILTINESYKLNRWDRGKHTAATRKWAADLIKADGTVEWWHSIHGGPVACRVEAIPYSNHKPRQDVGACAPTVKAIVDAFVDCGLWPDDTADWVTYLGYRPEEHRPDATGRGVAIYVVKGHGPLIPDVPRDHDPTDGDMVTS